ncbi:MAG: CarD family transcriptional regulator, partial [Planctomycetota bacterium]
MPAWFDTLRHSASIETLVTRLQPGTLLPVQGASGSSTTAVAAALHEVSRSPVLLVVPHIDDVDEAHEELSGLGISACTFPAMEVLAGESAVTIDLLADRLGLVRALDAGCMPGLVVASLPGLMQVVPTADRLERMYRTIRPGDRVDSEELLTWLDAAGYTRVGTIDGPGEVAVRGGIVDVYPAGGSPARIDLFGDEVDSIAAVDLATMGSDARLDRIDLVGASLDQIQTDEHSRPLTDLLPANTITVLADGAELAEQGRSYLARVVDDRGLLAAPVVIASFTTDGRRAVEIGPVGTLSVDAAATLPVVAMPAFAESVRDAILELAALAEEVATTVVCQNDGEAQRIGELLEEIAPGKSITVERRYLHRGFVWTRQDGAAGFAVVPYHELVHRYQTRRRIARIGGGRLREAFLDLEPGDYVVHRDHGIARFTGMAKLGGGSDTGEEYLTLEFSGSAKLHVPASHIDLVQKYIGAFKGQPELSKLGGKRWKRQKERVEEAVEDLASEMLRLQGLRESLAGITYPADTTWQREFDAAFPYPETDDQVSAI